MSDNETETTKPKSKGKRPGEMSFISVMRRHYSLMWALREELHASWSFIANAARKHPVLGNDGEPRSTRLFVETWSKLCSEAKDGKLALDKDMVAELVKEVESGLASGDVSFARTMGRIFGNADQAEEKSSEAAPSAPEHMPPAPSFKQSTSAAPSAPENKPLAHDSTRSSPDTVPDASDPSSFFKTPKKDQYNPELEKLLNRARNRDDEDK
jgi:hypothetical protein